MLYRLLLIVLVSLSSYVSADSIREDGYAATKYPIVLVGGAIVNFDMLGPIEQFYFIPYNLRKEGAELFISEVSASHSNEFRGEQLARQIEEILAITGKEKVNLISISMGGPTSRYVASVYPEMVQSVSMINGGHYGLPVFDVLKGDDQAPTEFNTFMEKLLSLATGVVNFLTFNFDKPTDVKAMLYAESTEGSLVFNEKYPEGTPTRYCGETEARAENGVYYYSLVGAQIMTNLVDPGDYLLFAGSMLVGFKEANDGFIGGCSSRWGQLVSDRYPMNHLDIANHLFGLTHSTFNPIVMYLQQANRLKNMGF